MNVMSSPMSKPLPSQRSRRATVLLIYVAFAALTAVGLAAETAATGDVLEALLFWAVIFAAIGAFLGLKRNVRRIFDLPNEELDERQLADRNRTYKAAYRTFGTLMVAVALYVFVTTSGRLDLPLPSTVSQANVAFWWVWLLAVSLPSAIMGWKEPDPVEESDVG